MKKIYITILFAIFLIPSVSCAADIFFNLSSINISNNQDFLIQVLLDTKGESVNAVAGSVLFPSDSLELKQILDGNSSVNFWLKKPHPVVPGQISFSGITSGGFYGSKTLLFSLVFHSNKLGSSSLFFDNLQILANDGLGTKISVKAIPIKLYIMDKKVENKDLEFLNDNNPPENFTPYIASDPDIFNRKKFLVFSTVDKGVGMDHYEVHEDPLISSFWFTHSKYTPTESPYLIKGQIFRGDIYVKAVDKNGNERIVKFYENRTLKWLKQIIIFVIILLICIFSFKKIKPKFFL